MSETTQYPRYEWRVDASAARRPDHLALVYGDRRWTYAALQAEMDRRAAMLVMKGLKPGDVVCMQGPSIDETILNSLACFRADLPFLFLSPKLAAAEVAALTAQAATACMLTVSGAPDPMLPHMPALPHSLPGVPDAAAIREAARRSAEGSPETLAYFQTSSGTTGGKPKLTRLAHRNATSKQTYQPLWETPEDIYYLPGTATFGPRKNASVLDLGATLILSDALAPERIEAEMAASGATVLYAVPPIVHLLVENPAPPPAGLKLRAICTITAGLPAAVSQAAARRYGGSVAMVQQYASTEGGEIACTVEGAPEGSVGKPYPNVTIRLVDEANVDVPEGDTGELIVQSPALMLGYANNPEATARALRDGWLYTGDLARRDAQGFYYIVGRKGLRINVGGFKVNPEEVEAVLLTHPSVREAVVLAMPDPRRGQNVRAVVVLRPGISATVSDLRHFCRASLATYKVPRHFEFRAELPRSPLGKVLRHLL